MKAPTLNAMSTSSAMLGASRSVIRTCTRTEGYEAWKALTTGTISESEMLRGAQAYCPRDIRESVGDDAIDCLAELGAVTSVLEHLGANISEAQATRRALEQSHPQLLLELRDVPAHVETGLLSARAAPEKLLASTTLAKIASALRSRIVPSLRRGGCALAAHAGASGSLCELCSLRLDRSCANNLLNSGKVIPTSTS